MLNFLSCSSNLKLESSLIWEINNPSLDNLCRTSKSYPRVVFNYGLGKPRP